MRTSKGITKDFKKIIRIYYENYELGTKEVMELFECGRAKAVELKRPILMEQAQRRTPYFDRNKINTKVAYEMWNIDIKDAEERYKRLASL